MSEQSILHVYASRNFVHMREMVPANEIVFKEYKNSAVAVRTGSDGFALDTNTEAERTAPLLNWFQLLLKILSNPNLIVIFHGAYWARIWWVIAFSSIFSRRHIFVCWGSELMPRTHADFASRVRFAVRDIAIRRCLAVVFLSRSDLEIAAKSHPKLERWSIIPYYNERHARRFDRVRRERNAAVSGYRPTLQIGNDASPANAHLECIAQIARFGFEKVLVLPMSYGRVDDAYIQDVEAAARRVPAAVVEVLNDLLPPDGFDEVIDRCDALIVGSKNQRGLYSIYAYLSSGKPVFLPEHSAARHDLMEQGFEIGTLESISGMTPEILMETVSRRNHRNTDRVHQVLGPLAIRGMWDSLLRGTSSNAVEDGLSGRCQTND